MSRWTADNIPDLAGRVMLVTGANSGLGLESARALAGKGAHVIMGCRDPQRAEAAAADIRASHPSASLELVPLDLSNLTSVRACAQAVWARHTRLDALLNNAGLMAIPYAKTIDGFEMQFGTNHLGHFALTGLLFELLVAAPHGRVVNVSSQAHRIGKLRWDDLAWEQGYQKWPAYGMSKLANLLFTYELSRRAAAKNLTLIAAVAHPGYTATNLQYVGAALPGAGFTLKATRALTPILGQPAAMGALPQLYATCAAEVSSGDFIGPDGLFSARGYPEKTASSAASRDPEACQRLWEVSEQLTSVRYAALS